MAEGKLKHIPSLDGLRAVSVMIVFFGHAGAGRIVPGGFGVTVFFVVSGYLITTLLRLEWKRTGSVSLAGFYRRRAFRIWPLFYAVLAVVAVLRWLVDLGEPAGSVASTVAQVLHVSNYWSIFRTDDPVLSGTGVYWSLAVEEHFYLFFPVLFIGMNRLGMSLRRQGAWLAALCAAVLAWRCVLVFGLDADEVRTYYATDTRIDSILIGCVMALVANPVLDRTVDEGRLLRRALVAAGAILATFAIRDVTFRETFRYSIQSVAIVPIMAYVVMAPASLAGQFLNSPIVAWFGRLSYAFYLVHFVILLELLRRFDTWIAGVIGFVAATAIAALLQRLIEQPFIRMRQRIERRGASEARVPSGRAAA